jgi:hypothetical protein
MLTGGTGTALPTVASGNDDIDPGVRMVMTGVELRRGEVECAPLESGTAKVVSQKVLCAGNSHLSEAKVLRVFPLRARIS